MQTRRSRSGLVLCPEGGGVPAPPLLESASTAFPSFPLVSSLVSAFPFCCCWFWHRLWPGEEVCSRPALRPQPPSKERSPHGVPAAPQVMKQGAAGWGRGGWEAGLRPRAAPGREAGPASRSDRKPGSQVCRLAGVSPAKPTVFLLLRRPAQHRTLLILLVHFSLSDI